MFAPYKYIKGSPARNLHKTKTKNIVALASIAFGVTIFCYEIIRPYAKSAIISYGNRPLFVPVLGAKTGYQANFSFSELNFKNTDVKIDKNLPEYFYLTIPKLDIYNARVKINDTNPSLDKSLGHYYGTSLPGESKNTFIYGHSTFEEYFDPENYQTIFSTLYRLSPGDIFYANYKGKEYKYLITMKKTVDPADVNPYENFYKNTPNSSTVTLMTCIPPGRKDYRLIVVGSLIE